MGMQASTETQRTRKLVVTGETPRQKNAARTADGARAGVVRWRTGVGPRGARGSRPSSGGV